ncbi:MAG: integrase arm-type DNA-binding domain-containing protein [Mariprofundales bacterium]|nr:integrase arm-type DNA-binding domain-containing protein [Mariprofundales bacterium]
MNYRHNGKHKTLALGVYPDVSLTQAREARAAAKALVKKGTDPVKAKKIASLKLQQQRFQEKPLSLLPVNGSKGERPLGQLAMPLRL